MPPKLQRDAFIKKLQTITCATGIEETSIYSDLHFDENSIQGIRFQTCFKKSTFKINIDKLFEAYKNNDELNTSDLKKYTGGAQSPALAILLAAGLTKHKTKKRQNHE